MWFCQSCPFNLLVLLASQIKTYSYLVNSKLDIGVSHVSEMLKNLSALITAESMLVLCSDRIAHGKCKPHIILAMINGHVQLSSTRALASVLPQEQARSAEDKMHHLFTSDLHGPQADTRVQHTTPVMYLHSNYILYYTLLSQLLLELIFFL